MRAHRLRSTIPPLAVLFALAIPVAAAAQQPVQPPAPVALRAPAGWLGVSYDLRWFEHGGACATQVVVDAVVPGAPADRAGLRAGDLIRSVDGDPEPEARLQALAGRLEPGDTVRLRVERGGETRQIVAVADRRPDRPPVAGAPVRTAPLVRVSGDTLVASAVPILRPGQAVRGYWLEDDDGRTVFRALPARPRTDLELRVVELLGCARPLPVRPAAVAQAEVERVQARADSLRVVIARRALESGEEARVRFLAPGDPPTGAVVMPAMAASLRGVAGAEVTELEPELADYFRGARTGLLVLRVAPGTAADRAGLRPGDVITAAAGADVESTGALRAAYLTGDGPTLDLAVVRQGRRRSVTIQRP